MAPLVDRGGVAPDRPSALRADRWIELDLYWFDHEHIAQSVSQFLDRTYGVKWPYAISFLFWCLTSAGTVFVRSISQLTMLRVILGVGESVVAPACHKWIRFNFAEKARGLVISGE
jgi:MFS family permease